jgi:tetratricopeptide (TPR) repeat protein
VAILDRLFGGGWARTVERAARLEESGKDGDALILYEQALAGDRKGVDADEVRRVEARAVELRDRIAEARIVEGRRLLEEGSPEAAEEAFRTAQQVAGSEAREAEAQACLDAMEAELARALASDAREPTEDEVFQALSGAWEEEQWDEYERYEGFREAYLAYHQGRPGEAIPVYERLLDAAGEDAVFILYELGRARAAAATQAGDPAGLGRDAVDALEMFIERVPAGVAPKLVAAAWNEVAQVHLENGDGEGAEDALMRAQEAVPGEPVAYLNLGRFLKGAGRAAEAVEALEQGVEVMDGLAPDFRLLAELGTGLRDVGRKAEAIESLEAVVQGIARHV